MPTKISDLGELGFYLKVENLDLFLKLKYLSGGHLMPNLYTKWSNAIHILIKTLATSINSDKHLDPHEVRLH